jgi:glycosyltransferase involved in cell wall biosynthesis
MRNLLSRSMKRNAGHRSLDTHEVPSPHAHEESAPDAHEVAVPREILGFVDSIRDGMINGWACDLADKRKKLTVTFQVDKKDVSKQETKVNRKDVAWIHDCQEQCGFSFPIPFGLISNPDFSFEIIVDGDPAVSLPSVEGLTVELGTKVTLPSGIIEINALRQALRSDLATSMDALVRLNNSASVRLKEIDPGIGNIFIINGARNSSSEIYRTFTLARVLRELGFTPLIFDLEDLEYLHGKDLFACVFVRVASTPTVQSFVGRLKREGVKVISDFDDLVFRPSLIGKIDGVRYLKDQERRQYAEGMLLYRQQIQQSDQVWVTTKYLVTEVKRYNHNVVQIGNYPLEEARKAAASLTGGGKAPEFIVGYYSGTLTHQADFRVCSKGILKFLNKYKDARLRIVGKFDISEFPALAKSSQVDMQGMLSYSNMIRNMAECSAILAPLEIGDEFCESKSELKFLDAALVSVPTVASATGAFKEAITHGKNGLLASAEGDWYTLLDELYNDRRLANEIGTAAHRSVSQFYSEGKQAGEYKAALDSLGISNGFPVPKQRLPKTSIPAIFASKSQRARLAILLPELSVGSGGHRKALTFCREYVLQGGHVEVLFMSSRSTSELIDMVREYYFRDFEYVSAYDSCPPDAEVVVATSWDTAYVVKDWDIAAQKFYFIQDFEPFFSPMSTNYALAYNSYRLGLEPIAFGDWNSMKLKREFGFDVESIAFPVDQEVYFPRRITRSASTLLFYARPSQPRRLFELGEQALLRLRPYLRNWRILYFGEDNYGSDIQGIEYCGRKTDHGELAELYSNATLGIAFSSSNPSLIPFEMLSCGLPVIDVDMGIRSADFAGCNSIVYAEPTFDSVARTILRVATDSARCVEMSEQAVIWAKRLPTDTEFARDVLKKMRLLQ